MQEITIINWLNFDHTFVTMIFLLSSLVAFILSGNYAILLDMYEGDGMGRCVFDEVYMHVVALVTGCFYLVVVASTSIDRFIGVDMVGYAVKMVVVTIVSILSMPLIILRSIFCYR